MKTAAVGKRKTSVYTEYMIGVDVEKFAQIGESVERRHCPTRKILPYGRSGFPDFSAIRVCVLLFITVGKNTAAIKEYIANQLKQYKESDQLSLFDMRDPFKGSK